MIDLFDLMREHYTPELSPLEVLNKHELSFINKAENHDCYTSLSMDQIKMLQTNLIWLLSVVNNYLPKDTKTS